MPITDWESYRWLFKEADALEKVAVLRGSADESAQHVRRLLVTFLLVAFYVAVIVFSTNDEQLLKETGARLPLLNVELPLLGFYIFIPWLVLIFHVHLLNQYFLLSRKLHILNQAITSLPQDLQRIQQILPFPLVFSHMIVGKHHPGLIRWAFSAAVVVTVVIVPITLLLSIKYKFLPYHNSWVTLDHQIALILDLIVMWVFWPRILARSGRWRLLESSQRRENKYTWFGWLLTKWQRWQILRVFAAGLSTAVVFVASTLLLVPPGDGIESFLGKQAWLDILHRNLDLREKTLMMTEPSPELIAAYKAAGDPPGKVWLDHGRPLDLRERNLRNADFYKTTLWDVDLRGANLQGAVFEAANLQGANLLEANLQGANLFAVNLQGAILEDAQLQRANLKVAKLQGAILKNAQLQGADLEWARLQGTNLLGAELRVANLQGANLQGAELFGVNLRVANLKGARLQGANLQSANLEGAKLNFAFLQGANFKGAWLNGADLVRAQLQGADLGEAILKGADLFRAEVYATEFAEANLSLTDLRQLVSTPVSTPVYTTVSELVSALVSTPDMSLESSFELMEHLELTLTSGAESWSDYARKRVQTALSRFWDIVFDPPLDRNLPVPAQATGALYDHCGIFADWPSPPDDNAAFDAVDIYREELLANLSCNDSYIAQALVSRVLRKKLMWFNLAQALLVKAASNTCPSLAKVVDENRKELEPIAQQTKQQPANKLTPSSSQPTPSRKP